LTVNITVTSMAYMFVYERVDFVKLSGTADFYSSQVYFYLGLFLLHGTYSNTLLIKSPDGQDRPAAECFMLLVLSASDEFRCYG